MIQLRDELFAKKTKKEIIQDLVKALVYVHSSKIDTCDTISHRDIKPENLLLHRLDRDGSLGIKLTDFDSSNKMKVGMSAEITSGIFTEKYLDPHIRDKKAEGEEVIPKEYLNADIYSLTLVIYEILTGGEYLFEGGSTKQTMINTLNNDRSNLMKADIDELLKNLLYTMSKQEPEARISAK